MRINAYYFVFLLMFWGRSLFAMDTVFVDQNLDEIDITTSYVYLKDTSQQLGIEEILRLKKSLPWIKNETQRIHFGLDENPYWFHFVLRNTSQSDQKLILFVQDPGIFLANCFVYPIETDTLISYAQSGISLSQAEKTIPESRILLPIQIKGGQTLNVFIKIKTFDFFSPKMELKDAGKASIEVNQFRIWLGVYYGVILFIILYMLLLFIGLRHVSYLYFALYSFFFGLISGAYDGFTAEFFPWLMYPNNTYPNFYSSVFSLFFTLLFLRSALDLNQFSRYLRILFRISFTYLGILMVVGFFNIYLAVYTFIYSTFAFLILVLYILIVAYQLKIRDTGNFIIAYMVLGVFSFISVLFLFKIIPYHFFTANSLHVGYLLHIIILFIVLGNRIILSRVELVTKELEKEKILAKKQTEELEQKVQERTKVLEDALEKQEELNQELESNQEEMKQNLAYLSEIKNKLEEAQINFKTSIDSSLQYVILLNPDAEIIIADQKFMDGVEKQFGKKVKKGDLIFNFMPEDGHETFMGNFKKALSGEYVRNEREIVVGSNYSIWLDIVYAPVIAEDKTVKSIVLSYLDITDRKKTENLLRENQLLISSINQNMKEGIYRSTRDKGLIYANNAFAELFGYESLEDILQAQSFSFYANSGQREELFLETELNKGLKNKEILFKRKDGSTFWGNLSCVMNVDANGNIYMDGLISDITEQKRNEEQLTAQNMELQKLNEELDRFVYSASHDLRAPIASAMGLVNVMKEEADPAQFKLYIQYMERTLQKLDFFVRDVIHYSRNTRLEVFKDEIDFKELLESVFEQYEFLENSDKIEKRLFIKQESPFYSDKKRLNVIFNNLISNAIRYSNHYQEHSFIEVQVLCEADKANIRISDNGLGIESEHLPRIFEMFYRANDKTVGSGLGLYIVKETLQKIKGSIRVESQIEIGTTFVIELTNLNPSNA